MGGVLGETGENTLGKVAGQVRKRVERGLRESEGGNDKKGRRGQGEGEVGGLGRGLRGGWDMRGLGN